MCVECTCQNKLTSASAKQHKSKLQVNLHVALFRILMQAVHRSSTAQAQLKHSSHVRMTNQKDDRAYQFLSLQSSLEVI